MYYTYLVFTGSHKYICIAINAGHLYERVRSGDCAICTCVKPCTCIDLKVLCPLQICLNCQQSFRSSVLREITFIELLKFRKLKLL